MIVLQSADPHSVSLIIRSNKTIKIVHSIIEAILLILGDQNILKKCDTTTSQILFPWPRFGGLKNMNACFGELFGYSA